MKIDEPGIYDDIPEAAYHADPVGPAPSLSASVAKLLVQRSPRHAAHAHPRLNPEWDGTREPTRPMEIGTAAHKVILGKGAAIDVLPFDDFRKKEAQQRRDAARAAGRTPILADDMESVTLLAEAARDQLATSSLAGYFDAPGQSEVTMVWRGPAGIWLRGRIDRLPAAALEGGHVVIADLKTTAGSAHPDDWQSVAFEKAYDVQADLYPRGLKTLIPAIRSVEFKFAVLEQQPPYGLSVVEFSGQAVEEAAQLVDLAMKMWAACIKRGEWPGYEEAIVDPPQWRSMRAELRRLAMLNRLADWQRPLELEGARNA